MRLSALRPTRRFWLTLAIALLVVALDALSKRVVWDTLAVGERREIVPDLLVLTHVRNTGAAYGLLTGHRWLLVLTAAFVAALTPLLLRSLPATGRLGWTGPTLTGMILGGAIGNLGERARSGYVTDFIQVPPIELFQVFNLADASISVAITALLVLSFLDRGEHPRPRPVPAEPAEARSVAVGEPSVPDSTSAGPPSTRSGVPHGEPPPERSPSVGTADWGGGSAPETPLERGDV